LKFGKKNTVPSNDEVRKVLASVGLNCAFVTAARCPLKQSKIRKNKLRMVFVDEVHVALNALIKKKPITVKKFRFPRVSANQKTILLENNKNY
jgi:hypothetical protein